MNQAASVLVVEDDDTLREALCDTIEFGGYRAVAAGNGREALSRLESERVDMVISDVQMDELDGHGLLREVRSRQPEMPFVMITAHGSVRDAVSAMRDGATDYLLKPFEAQVLLDMVARMQPTPEADLPIVAEDPRSQQLCALARRLAPSEATVLISGESGSGKEVLAHYIHIESNRADKPFLAVNCAAIPENMLESMLFGYEKGAYTGAYQSRPGKFEQANGGTLLLDEISEMDLGLQAKLLRVLQQGEYLPVGSTRAKTANVRFIAATNKDLESLVSSGLFREDLYYRLNVIALELPPLRQRREDIAPLVEHFLLKVARKLHQQPKQTDEGFMRRLAEYDWPGNVRELENLIERSVVLARGSLLTPDLLPARLVPALAQGTPVSTPTESFSLRDAEKLQVGRALDQTGWNKSQAAQLLGITRKTLDKKIRDFQLANESGG